jgi:pimeloyl-ACP methyl ester carboxylesterase
VRPYLPPGDGAPASCQCRSPRSRQVPPHSKRGRSTARSRLEKALSQCLKLRLGLRQLARTQKEAGFVQALRVMVLYNRHRAELDADNSNVNVGAFDFGTTFIDRGLGPCPGSRRPVVLPPKLIGIEFSPALDAIVNGEQRFTKISAPVLAIYALPHRVPSQIAQDSAARAGWLAAQAEWPAQADAFERGVPQARVVRIPNADHAVFASHPTEVLREIHAFVARLP